MGVFPRPSRRRLDIWVPLTALDASRRKDPITRRCLSCALVESGGRGWRTTSLLASETYKEPISPNIHPP
ncbi:hypothetical protein A0H81_07729 [Grifola frondosa]|uniref:Uncharacterized protein n=1 Tax=Grifola frondosa TaxID=5627 RepID=A0A1C7M6Z3_GRIFR|nr:hypothetical protein A0H81_07729 [Grifola frondosa]